MQLALSVELQREFGREVWHWIQMVYKLNLFHMRIYQKRSASLGPEKHEATG